MKFQNVTLAQVRAAADEAGLTLTRVLPRRDGFSATLKPAGARYRQVREVTRREPRPSWQTAAYAATLERAYGIPYSVRWERRPLVCYHGVREFLYWLFTDVPDAIVTTDHATYAGRQEFGSRFAAEAQCPLPRTRGSSASWLYGCACECRQQHVLQRGARRVYRRAGAT